MRIAGGLSQPSAATEGTKLPEEHSGVGRAVLSRGLPPSPPLLENSLVNCLPGGARLLSMKKTSKNADNTCCGFRNV